MRTPDRSAPSEDDMAILDAAIEAEPDPIRRHMMRRFAPLCIALTRLEAAVDQMLAERERS